MIGGLWGCFFLSTYFLKTKKHVHIYTSSLQGHQISARLGLFLVGLGGTNFTPLAEPKWVPLFCLECMPWFGEKKTSQKLVGHSWVTDAKKKLGEIYVIQPMANRIYFIHLYILREVYTVYSHSLNGQPLDF